MERASPIQGHWKVDAIGLPADALAKVYYRNAERIILKKWGQGLGASPRIPV